MKTSKQAYPTNALTGDPSFGGSMARVSSNRRRIENRGPPERTAITPQPMEVG
jgi:hypothetical protein